MTLLLVHLAATAFMTGLIWFVQVVHYPLMASVGESQFTQYAKRHQSLTTLVVAPMMLIEAATALLILLDAWQRSASLTLPVTGAALLAGVWLSTFLLQVPCHSRLVKAFDARVHTRLVQSNWARTVLWTARAAVAMALLAAR